MKKIIALLITAGLLAILLVALAFFYIDISGHRIIYYQMLKGDTPFASIKVDRYATEGKIVYKSNEELPYSLEYPKVTEELFIDKRTMTPLKFIVESEGVKGQKKLIQLVQKGEECDFLFIEHPRYIALEDFSTGENTMVFSPEDIMTYMPIMERYNFWKKGTQFFEIMIPVKRPLPPMRDKLEVRYVKEEFITVMGRKVEAESFTLDAKSLPEIKISLSKYTHRILSVDIKESNIRFTLLKVTETSGDRIKPFVDKSVSLFKKFKGVVASLSGTAKETPTEEEKTIPLKLKSPEVKGGKEVFFESGKIVLSGRVWLPKESGKFPAVLIVPEDGPMTKGEEYLTNSLVKYFSEKGTIVMTFDGPGQGKSQGSFAGMHDAKRISDIFAATKFLEAYPNVKEKSITLIGHGGGGYLALKAAEEIPAVRTCVLLEVPFNIAGAEFSGSISAEDIQKDLRALGFGDFETGFLKSVSVGINRHVETVIASTDNLSYFMGTQVPLVELRDLISRKPYKTMLDFNRPLFVIYSKDARLFDQKAVDKLKKALSEKDKRNTVGVFRGFDKYAGEMVEDGPVFKFSPNEAVLSAVGEWVSKNGVYTGSEIQVEDQSHVEDKGI